MFCVLLFMYMMCVQWQRTLKATRYTGTGVIDGFEIPSRPGTESRPCVRTSPLNC